MSDYSSLKKAVEYEIFGDWAETPLVLENEASPPESTEEFIQVLIIIADSEKENITDDSSIEIGAIMVMIHTPLNEGTNRTDELRKLIRTKLMAVTADNGNLSIINVRSVPAEDPTMRYNRVNMEAQFIFNYHS